MKNVYLFFGEEKYLIKENENKLKKALIPEDIETMNYEVFEESRVDAEKIMDSASTLPFLNDTRLVVAKNTGFFSSGKKDETESIYNYLQEDLGRTILLFIEESVDKRNKLYKKFSQIGEVKEFTSPSEKTLIGWLQGLIRKEGCEITNINAAHLLMTVAADMETTVTEAQKLCAYKGVGNEISREDIDLICTKALETKIFEMVDAIGMKRPEKALEIYNNIINLKQSPLMALAMISRQFRLILQAKYMDRKNYQKDEISKTLKIKPFVTGAYIRQGGNFTIDTLLMALEECLETDVSVKTGKIDEKIGVELLIIKYST